MDSVLLVVGAIFIAVGLGCRSKFDDPYAALTDAQSEAAEYRGILLVSVCLLLGTVCLLYVGRHYEWLYIVKPLGFFFAEVVWPPIVEAISWAWNWELRPPAQ